MGNCRVLIQHIWNVYKLTENPFKVCPIYGGKECARELYKCYAVR